jgi:hypothetical protein
MIIYVINYSLLRNPTAGCWINVGPFPHWQHPTIHPEFFSFKVERLKTNVFEENEINWVK